MCPLRWFRLCGLIHCSERLPLIYFLIIFAALVLGVFSWLVAVLKKVVADDQVIVTIKTDEGRSPVSPMRPNSLKAFERISDLMWPGASQYLRWQRRKRWPLPACRGISTCGVQGFFVERDDVRAMAASTRTMMWARRSAARLRSSESCNGLCAGPPTNRQSVPYAGGCSQGENCLSRVSRPPERRRLGHSDPEASQRRIRQASLIRLNAPACSSIVGYPATLTIARERRANLWKGGKRSN